MDIKTFIKQAKFIRSITLLTLRDLNEEKADEMLDGWNNTIRWHLGHILWEQDSLIYTSIGKDSPLQNTYKELFASGTKPAKWTIAPPTLIELKSELEEQPNRIEMELMNIFGEMATESVRFGKWIEMNSIEEISMFTLIHEGMHIGSLKKLVSEV